MSVEDRIKRKERIDSLGSASGRASSTGRKTDDEAPATSRSSVIREIKRGRISGQRGDD